MESPSPLARYIPQKSKKRVFPGSSTSYVDPEAVEISPHVQWSSKSNSLKQKEVVNPDVIDIDMDDEDSGGAVLVNEKIEAQNTKGKEALTSFLKSHNNLAKSGTVDGVQSSKESVVPGPRNSVILEGFSYDNSYGDDDYMEMYHDELTYDDKYAFMQAHFDSMDIPPGVEAPIPWFHPQIKDNPAHANSSNHTIVPSQLDTPGSDFLHSWGLLEPAQTGKKLTSWSDFHEMEQTLSWPLPESAHTNWSDFNGMEQSSSLPLPESVHTNWSDFHGMEQSSSWPLPESAHTKWKSAVPTISTDFSSPIESGATNLPAGLDPYGMEQSSSWLLPESAHTKWKSAVPTISTYFGSPMESGATNLPPGLDPWRVPVFSYGKKKPTVSGSTTNYTSHNQPGTNKPSSVVDPSKGCRSNRLKKLAGKSSLTYSRFSAMDPMNLAPGVDAYMSGWHVSSEFTSPGPFMGDNSFHSFDPVPIPTEDELYAPWLKYPAKSQTRATAAGTSTVPFGASSIEKHGDETEILKKFQHFKQFDTVQDHSEHRYSCNGHLVKQPPKNWTKKIQEEWRILEKDLPDTIFVRVYESRMDLLRAAIIGAEGTPYHDGLFFFDVFFPCGYPNVPPHVYYHSGGLRINPNLYNCGKVCLSLLNTWGGSQNEKWIPGVSTMLQVLVSIQALILNAKPYFNEPGYARMSGSANGEKNSQQYNESTFILSLKTMVYTMRRPPKHFEDFVAGHFCKRAHDILVACKAYMNGAQVGCLVNGGVQDVDAGDKSCSKQFKCTLAGWLNSLVQAFSQIGAKDCEKFLSPAEQAILQTGATDTNWGEGQGES